MTSTRQNAPQFAASIGEALRLPDPFRGLGTAQPIHGRRLVAPAVPPPPQAAFEVPADTLLEFGLTCAALRLFDAAIDALEQAAAKQPNLHPAWCKLAELHRRAGNRAKAASSQARAATTATPSAPARPPKPVSRGKRAQAEQKLKELARQAAPQPPATTLRNILLQSPADAAALRLLAQLTLHEAGPAAAQPLLERALELAPDYTAARLDYVHALMTQGMEARALPHIDRLLAQDAQDETYRRLRAGALSATGQHDAALEIYQSILTRGAQRDPRFWLNYGRVLRFAGRRADCVQAYRTCLEIAPTKGEAYWGIANLKYEKLTGADLAAIETHLASPELATEDRFHFHYAIGYALEREGSYENSFFHYAAGADVRAQALRAANEAYSAEEATALITRHTTLFTPAFLAARAGAGHPSPAPIFILGMPRAGSTLLEQILASHSQIEGTQELAEIGHIAREIEDQNPNGVEYPECLQSVHRDDLAAYGAAYLQRAAAYRKTDLPYFIDKMPFNWLHIGLIQLILPNAKIIDARRHSVACCFSVFKQLIGHGAEFTYNLNDLGRYYRDYETLMAHFDAVLPGRIHRVMYEHMVEDTDSEINRLLAYCGVPFEEQCLRFWETKRSVATPSSEQVRRPIFRDGLDQWRNYEPWLADLKAGLGMEH